MPQIIEIRSEAGGTVEPLPDMLYLREVHYRRLVGLLPSAIPLSQVGAAIRQWFKDQAHAIR